MFRRLFTFLTALSLLLCVVICALWVWSYAKPAQQTRTAAPTTVIHRELGLGDGYVGFSTLQWLTANPAHATDPFPGFSYGAQVSGWSALGLHWRVEHMTLLHPGDRKVAMVLTRSTIFSVWLGLPLLVSLALPTCWVARKWKVSRRKQPGACRVCGYDLRATPQRCPECGAAPAQKLMNQL
ncbi:MAG: hypothetical protein JWO87_672 [Phycisphaerales bacterium]|nr:hypothetical protein [Phycisphaerales bacterium]